MAEQDDDSKPRKKISVEDMSAVTPKTAPELDGESEPDEPEDTEPAETDKPADDAKDDEAVEDIVKTESDDALKVQDEKAAEAEAKQSGFKAFWKRWWKNPKTLWGSIAAVVVVLGALAAVPYTRYNLAGLVLKAPVTVQAVDSKSGQPVTGATVMLGQVTAETDAAGKAVLHVHAGSRKLVVSKKYYTGVAQKELVALSGNSFKVSLVALGQQVQVKVVNKLTGKPVANAAVTVQGSNAKTDSNGLATVVIGSSVTVQEASVSLDGYNTAKASIFATGGLAKNTFGIVPAGKLYFLSNLSGNIDVVKTDLDGSNRQTVVEGTGHEDKNSTSLLASRDWKYLALLSKRTGDSNASLYLIDTTNGDKLTTIDQGNASFSLAGWSGDTFVYQVTRNSVSDWQPNRQAIKAFSAATGQNLLLDQTQATGTDAYNYLEQTFGPIYLMGNQVVYSKNWFGSQTQQIALNAKQSELDSIGADGSAHKVIKSFTGSNGYSSISTLLYEPAGLYIYITDADQNAFYTYDNGTVSANTTLTSDTFYQTPYPTYLLSPSGNSTFWGEQRDGKNTLFTGDVNAKSPKQVASLSDYNTYGWFTDDYLLVSKSSSELYILPAAGGTPFKITDYYKPAINYQGYGGGYGGL